MSRTEILERPPSRQLCGQRLLIVGARGYIGRYLTSYALARGAHVVGVSSGECDLRDPEAVAALFDSLGSAPYAVVFLAVIKKAEAGSFDAFVDNTRLVQHLIEGCARAQISSILYFSSADVYGRRPALPITEQSRLAPDSWYALAKATSEWMLLSSGQVRCPVTILRLPGVYGRSPNDRSVIGRMVEGITREGRVRYRGRETLLRDYVWVDDLCRLLERLIPLRYHGVLNVATGESRSLRQIAQMIGTILGRDVEMVREGDDQARSFDLQFDIQALRRLVPDVAFSDLAAGVRSYLP